MINKEHHNIAPKQEQEIEIHCLNSNVKKSYPMGISAFEILQDQKITLDYPVLGVISNNSLKELTYRFFKPKTIEFFDYTYPGGARTYMRSLSFILVYAFRKLFPGSEIRISHSVSKGYFCELINFEEPDLKKAAAAIKNEMKVVVSKDLPFIRKEIVTNEAVELFKKAELYDKASLFRYRKNYYSSIYFLDNQVNYFYGYLVPSTGYITNFDLIPYYSGLLLRVPSRHNPDQLEEYTDQHMMFKVFREHKKWIDILNVSYAGSLNNMTKSGEIGEIIKISEALHEKKIVKIADSIVKKKKKIKVVLIAGPSSSGKTTFTKRLAIQLMVSKLKPVIISLDDYFLERSKTPKLPNGDFDFETIHAINLELFRENIISLLDGNPTQLPHFDFVTGKSILSDDIITIKGDSILLIEGIHALNPILSDFLPETMMYKVFVSALTQIAVDCHNRISTTDNRLLRRLIRDHKYRNYSAIETLQRWEHVREGEDINIFPYQEYADVMFNSSLLYEFGVLKKYAEPLLREIYENVSEHIEAVRLLKFLSYFLSVEEDEIPPTSILREFLGKSSFRY